MVKWTKYYITFKTNGKTRLDMLHILLSNIEMMKNEIKTLRNKLEIIVAPREKKEMAY